MRGMVTLSMEKGSGSIPKKSVRGLPEPVELTYA
jgi:hypothetical protein